MFKHTKTSLIINALIMLAIGLFCICTPQGAIKSVAWILGVLFIVGGVFFFIFGRNKDVKVDPIHLIAALLMATVGIIIIVRPSIIAVLVGLVVLLEGLDFIALSIRYRQANIRYWGALLAVGIIVFLLGLWAVLSPWVGATMLSVLIGIGCIAIAADCIMALLGIGRVETFFKEVKNTVNRQLDNAQEFQDAEEIKE